MGAVTPAPESMGNMGVRIVREDSYGVLPGTPSWKRLNDVKMVPKPQYETDMFAASGMEAPSVAVLNDAFTNLDVTGRLSYTSLMYILSSLFGYPETTLVGGSTYDHVWTWDAKTPIVPISYAMHYGTAARARQVLGVVFNGLTTGISRGGLDFGSSAFGKELSLVTTLGGVTNEVQTIAITGTPTGGGYRINFRGAQSALIAYNATAAAVQTALENMPTIGPGAVTVTGGPHPGTPVVITFTGRLGGQDIPAITTTNSFTGGTTPNTTITQTTAGADNAVDVAAQPIFPLHFNVFADDSWAAALAGTTQLRALYNMSLGIGERLDRSRPVDRSRASDSVYLRDEQEHTVDLRLGADATAEGLYDNVNNGTMKFVRAHAMGPGTGDSTHKYEFDAVMAMLIAGNDGYDSENGIHVMTWNGRIARDTTTGNAARFRLRNRIASL